MAHLTVCDSSVAYGAYYWLVHKVSPALAGTYAYVIPAVVVLFGCWLGGESLNRLQLVGTGVILIGVVLVGWSQRLARPVLGTSRQ
jgi:drug/metabolite transporter (DMT)-like permease